MQFLDQYGDSKYDGYALKRWMTENCDIAVYIAGAYLIMVFAGPKVIAALSSDGKPGLKDTTLLKKVWVVWNLALSAFAFYGATRVMPVLVRNLLTRSLHDTLCTFREEEFYTTHVGFAMGMMSISKFPEFGDTVFLLLQGKRTLPLLQWFHHSTVFLYAWHAYAEGSSIYICFAAMNYFVHAIMYFYFAMAEAGYKNLVKPFAMYITLLQIVQMVGGLFFTGFVMREKFMNGADSCPGSSWGVARAQMLIYVTNMYFFSDMFLSNYVFRKKQPQLKKAE